MSVDDPVWTRAEITLPDPLLGRLVVAAGVGGGPAPHALPTDDIDPRLHETVARAVAGLGPDDTLVSFVTVENDVDWPWQDLHGP